MEKEIREIQENLKLGKYQNEAAVSQGIIQRILASLSWPIYDTSVVIPEYSIESKRVDFALCHPPNKPLIFIEIKQVGQSVGAEKQLFEYAFYQGIPLAILTYGQEWQFFLPAEQGEFSDRRVYKLDFLERNISDIVEVLNKYLSYENVRSGKAIESARKDYRNIRQQREAAYTLPDAWQKLIDEGDELLIDLLTDKVGSLCGYKPSPDKVIQFLSNQLILSTNFTKRNIIQKKKKIKPSVPIKKIQQTGFELFGEFHSENSARDAMLHILNLLADNDPTFLDRYASLQKHGRTRRYLAKNREELNPSRPDLAFSDEYSRELRPGWWVDVNLSKQSIEKVVKMACQVASIKFGKDLKLYL